MTDANSTDGGLGQGNADPKAHRKRERSAIEFPYTDLTEAMSLARAVHHVGGSSCEWDQLAAHMGLIATGGGFRQRVTGARVFRLVDYFHKKISLTELGAKICDSAQEEPARVQAFLAVPLYKAVFDQFSGTTLPPASGLESAMSKLGVPQKQAKRARQVFQRSADQAGFFWSGSDRLVKPALGTSGGAEEHKEDARSQGGAGNEDQTTDGRQLHPFVEGLIESLPNIGEPWSLGKRVQWLQAAISFFNLIYPDDDSGASIEVRLLEESK